MAAETTPQERTDVRGPNRPFHVMAKPVCGTCNLECRYCYYTAKPRELYPGVRTFRMSTDVLEAYTRQYLALMPERCEFSWQGGEPLLIGLDFFRRAIELQKQHAKDGQAVTNALQTNGLLLDDEWCGFLREHQVLVGVSIDGPPQWHDRFRRDRWGKDSFRRAWAGLERLRKHGVDFNILATLNSANAPHGADVYRFFVNRGIHYLQFIPILERAPDGSVAAFSCSAEDFGRFYLEVFEQWTGRDVGRVSERFFDNLLHVLVHGQASMCCYAERCGDAHVLEFNGDLYACDHFVFPEWKIGDLFETPLAELRRDPKLEAFAQLKTELPSACRDCEFLPYCRGGCPKHHAPVGTDADRVNHFCEGYKLFFRHALPELKRIAEHVKQGRLPPVAGAATQARKPAAAPTPPKRNAPCPCGSGLKFKHCCGRK